MNDTVDNVVVEDVALKAIEPITIPVEGEVTLVPQVVQDEEFSDVAAGN